MLYLFRKRIHQHKRTKSKVCAARILIEKKTTDSLKLFDRKIAKGYMKRKNNFAHYRKPKQLSFIKNVTEFGGTLLVGKRKEARPLSAKSPLHVVLKSENAKGKFCLINHKSYIEDAVAKVSAKFRVKIYEFSVNNNHLHFAAVFKSRRSYNTWVRTLTATIVKIISRRTKTKLKNFFTQRPYTKIVSWGRQFRNLLNYVVENQLEYFGLRQKKSIAPKKALRALVPLVI